MDAMKKDMQVMGVTKEGAKDRVYQRRMIL